MSVSKTTFEELPNLAQLNIKRLSEVLDRAVPKCVRCWEIENSHLEERPKILINEVFKWADKNPCIYFIEILPGSTPLDKLTDAFKAARVQHEKSGLKYARFSDGKGPFFYVGSSHSLATRLNEHLGYGHKGTYSLQLKHWAPTGLKLKFVCAKYTGVEPDVLQILEDTLWEIKKPIFGKRGGR